jgi:hypothetical protein
MAKDRHDDEDDYYLPPPPKKSGASAMLILGIVLGAGVLLVLLVVICGGAFFLGRVAGPDEPPAREEIRTRNEGPAANTAPAKVREPEGMKAKGGPPAGPDK